MLIKLTRKLYRILFEVFLWIILIACTVGGAGLFATFGDSGEIILGLVLGFLVGVIVITLIGGFFATFLNIDENLEKINGNLEKVIRKIDNLSVEDKKEEEKEN